MFAQDSELYDAEAVKYQEQLDGAAALESTRAAALAAEHARAAALAAAQAPTEAEAAEAAAFNDALDDF